MEKNQEWNEKILEANENETTTYITEVIRQKFITVQCIILQNQNEVK